MRIGPSSSLWRAGEAHAAPFSQALPNVIGAIMKIVRLVRSQAHVAYALSLSGWLRWGLLFRIKPSAGYGP